MEVSLWPKAGTHAVLRLAPNVFSPLFSKISRNVKEKLALGGRLCNMKKNSRIMLWGWFGFENLGDDLLLNTMLKHLHGEITVPMETPYKIPNVTQVKHSYKEFLSGALHNDTVIIGPGGLFPVDKQYKALLYLLITRLWALMGRKVIFFGIGISEKMSDFSSILWRKMAKSAVLFLPRSEKILERIGIEESEKIHSMADCVFASEPAKEQEYIDENRVAISVANLNNLKYENKSAFDDAVSKWSDVVRGLVKKGFSVDLIAFTKGADDRLVDAILTDLGNCADGGVHPIYYETAADALDGWKKYKFVICMRFHSLVLSVLNDVPAVPIAYGHKTLSLAEKCGLGDYTLVWNTFQKGYFGKVCDLSADEILEKAESLCMDLSAAREKIAVHRKALIGSANRSFSQLDTVLYK